MGQGSAKEAARLPLFELDPRLLGLPFQPQLTQQWAVDALTPPDAPPAVARVASAVLAHHARRVASKGTPNPLPPSATLDLPHPHFVEIIAEAMGASPLGPAGAEGGAAAARPPPTPDAFWIDPIVTDNDGAGLTDLVTCALFVAGVPASDAEARADELVRSGVLTRRRATVSLPLPVTEQKELLRAWVSGHLPGLFEVLLRGWFESTFLPPLPSASPDAESAEDPGEPHAEPADPAADDPHPAVRFPEWLSALRPVWKCEVAVNPVWGLVAPVPGACHPDGTVVAPKESILTMHATPVLVAAMLPAEYRRGGAEAWVLLYASEAMGKGVTRLQHYVFKYPDPTVLVALAADGSVYGMATDAEWRDQVELWGSSCRGLLLSPGLSQSPLPQLRMNLNTRGRGGARGLGLVDPKTGKKALWMDADFEQCQRSFGAGCLPGLSVESTVVRFEVWGCGGLAGVKTQQSRQNVGRALQERAAKAKRPDWNADRDLLVMAGTNAGRHIANGEAGRIGHDDDDEPE